MQATELITGLATALILTNFTSPETYASFGYVVAVLGVASLASLPGIDPAIVRAAAKGHDGVLGYATRLRARTSLAGTGAMLLWAGGLLWAGREPEALAVAGCGILLPLLYPFTTVFPFLQGKKKFAEYTWAIVAIEVAKTASVAAAVLAFSWEGTAVVLTPFVIMSIGYWAVNRRYATAGSAAPGSDFDRNARVLSATAVLGVVASQVDRVLVGTFFAPTAMAAYTLGVTLTYPVRSLGGLASKLLLPRILDADAASPSFRRTFGFGLAAGAVALTAIVAAYWIVFPLVQPLLFPAYSDTGPVVRWLALATALSAFDVVAVQALWGLNDLRAFYWTQSVFPLQRIALLAMGAYLVGVPGILAAQVAHYLLCAAVILAVWLTAAPKPASA